MASSLTGYVTDRAPSLIARDSTRRTADCARIIPTAESDYRFDRQAAATNQPPTSRQDERMHCASAFSPTPRNDTRATSFRMRSAPRCRRSERSRGLGRCVASSRYGDGSATQNEGRRRDRMQGDFPAGPLARIIHEHPGQASTLDQHEHRGAIGRQGRRHPGRSRPLAPWRLAIERSPPADGSQVGPILPIVAPKTKPKRPKTRKISGKTRFRIVRY
jgi:hypothetical protein